MKYIKIFENAPVINNPMVQFTSKSDKLETIKNEINAMLSTMGDKQIGFNYANGSKGIFFTNSQGELVDASGYAVTTYSELSSNLESILYTLKQLHNDNTISLPTPPTGEQLPQMPEISQDGPIEIINDEETPNIEEVQIRRFESFQD